MKRCKPLPDGWIKTVMPVPENRGALSIYTLEKAPQWTEWAYRFWKGDVPGKETIKEHDWGGYVYRARLDEETRLYYCKRFSIRNLRFLHKPPRARYTIVHEAKMRDFGFRTPKAVALIESRRMGVVVDSALVTEGVSQAFRMFDLFNKDEVSNLLDKKKRRALLRAFGKEVGRLHSAGFYHGDMHWGNVLCRMEKDRFLFFWTDNERGRELKNVPFRLRVDDLNQVNKYRHRMSRTDRLRMWRAYLEETHLPEQEANRMLKRILERSLYFWKKKGWL